MHARQIQPVYVPYMILRVSRSGKHRAKLAALRGKDGGLPGDAQTCRGVEMLRRSGLGSDTLPTGQK